jgi:hypothetical protein
MNTVPRPCFSRQPRPFNVLPDPQPAPARREYRERDYGIGYGNSSGYAARRQYVSGWNGEPRFRCG